MREKSLRLGVSMSPVTAYYLEELSRLGLYGTSVQDVMRGLVESGIRDAINNETLRIARPRDDLAEPVDDTERQSPRDILLTNKVEILRYTRILLFSIQEALEYDPEIRRNEPPPILWIDDQEYLAELRSLVSELRRLNDLLEGQTITNGAAKSVIKGLPEHFDSFLSSYSTALGTAAAALTVGSIAALLFKLGVGGETINSIWSYLKLPK